MMIIPTIRVYYQAAGDEVKRYYRIPRDKLEGFLHILFFNGIHDVEVFEEKGNTFNEEKYPWAGKREE